MSKHDIYGPDLSEHESEGARIASEGMKIMRGAGTAPKEENCDGPGVSHSELNKFSKLCNK